ncbi:MAG: hypothetical protein WCJ35_22885, partial [Planctomycetota bacterium]
MKIASGDDHDRYPLYALAEYMSSPHAWQDFQGGIASVWQDSLADGRHRGTGILPVSNSTGWKPVPRAHACRPLMRGKIFKEVSRVCGKILWQTDATVARAS